MGGYLEGGRFHLKIRKNFPDTGQPQLSLDGISGLGRKAAPLPFSAGCVQRLKRHVEGLLRRKSVPRMRCWTRQPLRLLLGSKFMILNVLAQMCIEPCLLILDSHFLHFIGFPHSL